MSEIAILAGKRREQFVNFCRRQNRVSFNSEAGDLETADGILLVGGKGRPCQQGKRRAGNQTR
jgi:hypothetical protein